MVIECSKGEVLIFRPKTKQLTYVRLGDMVLNEVMPVSVINGMIYASIQRDAGDTRASFAFNIRDGQLKTNFDKEGKNLGSKTSKCTVQQLG